MNNSTIISFYEEKFPDLYGRYLSDILTMDDSWLERTHNYIQILFPNKDPSSFNPDAPLLTDEVITEFKSRPELKIAVKRSLDRMFLFYRMRDNNAHPWWITKNNHNYLRCTRILHTLRAFKMYEELDDFYINLMWRYINNKDIIEESVFNYWKEAYEGSSL